MERDNNFNYESRNSKKDNKRKEHHSKNKGEITKMDTKVDSYARGMPLRGGFEQNYMLENNNNYGLVDFEVFEKKPKLKVQYDDPISYKNYSNLEEQSINANNDNNFTDLINQFTVFMFNYVSKKSPNALISPFSIFEIFAILYRGSKNNTEIELRNFFTFPSKQITINNLLKINDSLNRSKLCLVKICYFLIVI